MRNKRNLETKVKTEATQEVFTTYSISTGAAIITAGAKLHALENTLSGKKLICLVPKEKALSLYHQLLSGTLVVNALDNSLEVQRLKSLIFGNEPK